MGEDNTEIITCWSCKSEMKIAALKCNDGLCPLCNCEIDLEDDDDD